MNINTKKIRQLILPVCGSMLLSSTTVHAKKNVLFLMADDFNYWAKCLDYQDQAQTPNIDALAKKGVLFTSGLCSSPVCNPSRNALWSGYRPSTTMIQSNQDGYVRDKNGFKNIVTMHQYFKLNGYYVLGSGKMWHPGSMGNKETDPTNWSEIITDGTGCNGGTYKKYNGSQYGWSGNTGTMTESNCKDYALAKKIAGRIANYHTSSNKNKPFFIGCGLFRPHSPFNSPKTYWDRFDASKIGPGHGVESQWYVKGSGDKNHKEITNAGAWNDGIHGYLASMALTDDNIGIIMDAVENSPLRDSIIVCFMGDHGWDLGEHGRWGKFARWNSSNNTTMIIYDPSAKGNGQVCTKPVSMQDMYRTLIDLCDLPKKNDVEGYSIAHLLDCPNDEYWTHPALMSYGGKNYIKTEKWYFINDGNSSQLYDNIADPYQWKNLYGNSAYNSVVADLRHDIDSIVAIGTRMKADLINNNGVVKPENYFVQQSEVQTSCSCEDTIKPSKPENLVSEESSPTSIAMSWSASTDNISVSAYDVYVDNTLVQSTETNSAVISNLLCDKSYSITVRARDACQNLSDFSTSFNASTLVCDTEIPTVPGSLIVTDISETSSKVAWGSSTDNLNEVAYEIYINDELLTSTNDTFYVLDELNCGSSYDVKVRAFDPSLNFSSFNSIENFQTLVCPPCTVNFQGGNGAEEEQSAYLALTIPGKIEAENFDNGGQNIAYYETDGRAAWAHPTFRTNEEIDVDEADGNSAASGVAIGGIAEGEWAEYTVNVASAGEYSFKINYGCNGDKQIYFKVDNTIVGCINTLPSTDKATTYSEMELPFLIDLTAGEHVIAWVSESSFAFNIDYFTFKLENPSTNYNLIVREPITYLISNVADSHKGLYLNLMFSDPSVEINIYDINGKHIVTDFLAGEMELVPYYLPEDINPGMYIIKISNDLTESIEKFMVN